MKKITALRSPLLGFLLLFVMYHIPNYYNTFQMHAIFKISFLFVALLIAIVQGSKGLNDFGLKFSKRGLIQLGVGLAIGIVVFIGTILLADFFQADQIVEVIPIMDILKQLPMVLVITFFPSIAEDILVRGYFIKHASCLGNHQWVWFTATLFFMNHFWRFNQHISVLFYIFILGIVLGYAVIITKNLWFALGIHWGANITYEASSVALTTQNIGSPYMGNWIVGIFWLIVGLIFLGYFFKSKNNLEINF